jgi:enoyl-CoA hydratase/carnithine racemase
MSEHVVTELRGTALHVTMRRPEKKNAMTLAMYDALTASIDRADRDEAVQVLVLAGQPGAYTAGNDLVDFMQNPPSGQESPVLLFIKALIRCKKPVVALVDGVAVGLGTTMLLHCDFVIATERARFLMPFTKLGLVPEAASSVLVPMLFGYQRAASWLLLGRSFGPEEALAAGMVMQVVKSEELASVGDALCAELAALPQTALRLSKQLVRRGLERAVKDAMTEEGVHFMERVRSPETAAVLMAFTQKKQR